MESIYKTEFSRQDIGFEQKIFKADNYQAATENLLIKKRGNLIW